LVPLSLSCSVRVKWFNRRTGNGRDQQFSTRHERERGERVCVRRGRERQKATLLLTRGCGLLC